MLRKTISRFRVRLRNFLSSLLHDGLQPAEAASAIFVGVFIAHIPIYGFQAIFALGVAAFFGLNKPLTVSATFINNPLTQPVLLLAAVVLGQFLLTGQWQPGIKIDMSVKGLKDSFAIFMVGSLVLGVALAAASAGAIFVVLRLRLRVDMQLRNRFRFVNGLFDRESSFDRRFVRWTLRLDRIFEMLAKEDLGTGTAVDLGCGYGTVLAFVAYDQPGRVLFGCDLDANRVTTAQGVLASWNPTISVEDVRRFLVPPAQLILILDVLQYLDAQEQIQLLIRCATALEPGGKLMLRVHDPDRGLLSRLSLPLNRPLLLQASEYRDALESTGLHVEARRMRNRFPLSHIVFLATKPTVADPA